MGPQAAAAKLGITVQNVNTIMQSFYSNFRTVKQWISDTKRWVNFLPPRQRRCACMRVSITYHSICS
jgi:hypothetical protein